MAEDVDDETFFKDLALALVTFGFYMPYWLWRKNQDLVEYLPKEHFPNNGWWLSGGAALALFARSVLGSAAAFDAGPTTMAERVPPAAGAALGILAFLAGVYLFTNNLLLATRRLHMSPSDPPWWFPTALGVVFIGIELGNVFQTWWLRAPVLAALFALPYFFYRAHRDFARVEKEALKRLTNRPGSATPMRPTTGGTAGASGPHRAG